MSETGQKRVILLIMDSFGIGGASDAAHFGDEGSDTFGHIAKWCADGNQSQQRKANGALQLPNLTKLGLINAAHASTGNMPAGLELDTSPTGSWGFAREISRGKDTPSGHWEIAGLPVLFEWGYFPTTAPCFNDTLIYDISKRAEKAGINFSATLGNKHASGTDIIKEFGEQHCATKMPIFYTSSDSVLQIAAHEQHFGLDNLYKLCEIARKRLDKDNIGRIIARPFVGETRDEFRRTGNRRDYSVLPHGKTVLNRIIDSDCAVWAVGKISDIFAHQGITHSLKASGHDALMANTLNAMEKAQSGDLIFTNFVEFDQSFGHRRDVAGYANALEEFDAMLPALFDKLRDGDRVIITADHGCDPTWAGTDHTRENIPVLIAGKDMQAVTIGGRETFADIGESIADYLELDALNTGTAFKL